MRIPITPLGGWQFISFGVIPLALGIALLIWTPWYTAVLPLALGLFVFSFFRDPERRVPEGEGLLVSAADGKVVSILPVEEKMYLKGPGIRIGVFLSVFNVHVNRAPASGVVEMVRHTEGRFLDARDSRCSEENESNSIGIKLDDGRRILVRQVAGFIARRIICTVKEGDRVERGQRIGMIKFGSYTEVVVEDGAGFKAAVTCPQVVAGASTVLFRQTGSA